MRRNSRGWQVTLTGLALALMLQTADAQRGPRPPPDYDSFYSLGPDSLVQRGVAKGEVLGPFTLETSVYPGVEHDYWVYVPAQYDGETEASLMLFNDGATYLQPDGYYRAVNVLDNLIWRGELPVMIAAFIDPGVVAADGSSVRQQQYDPVDDRYSRLIVDELLPRLYAEYRIARDPARHGIGGWSSGAIAAFTVAWERPDQFSKVLSGIGTFVDLSGGHVYPEKVRASEPKPIRVFMIDGRNDNRGLNDDDEYDETRDWFYQNVRLKNALVEKGYDVNFAWGIGVHSHDMGGAMLPEMLRWLWRDHPVSTDPRDAEERAFRAAAD
ncbi:MAG: alpha/beta hydrolase-fold protein [Gammaproteobacteria bacterium]